MSKIKFRREDCEYFDKGYCHYPFLVYFHENRQERGFPSDSNRCNRLVHRTRHESMDWMASICEDCNELECNDCNLYAEYRMKEEGIKLWTINI